MATWHLVDRLPEAVHRAAVADALRRNRGVVGNDLFLLAVAGLDGPPPARQALEQAGAGADRLRAGVHVSGEAAPGPGAVVFPPAYYALAGRAQGFAAALGDGTVTPEHLLLALLWDPHGLCAHLLKQVGVGREQVVARLAALGVPVPAAPWPADDEVEMGEQVWFEKGRLPAVRRALVGRLADVRWAWNTDGDRAWVQAEAGVDLEALVAAVAVDPA
jgi:hypothetical protein